MSYQEDFINMIAPYVTKYAKQYGYRFPSAIIAQAAQETGWNNQGKGNFLAKYYNFFGMKCGSKWTGKSVNKKTKEEYTAGTLTTITANFRAYDSLDQGIKGYFEFISTGRYSNLKNAKSSKNYLEILKADGYATDSKYVNNVYKHVTKYNLQKYDNGQVADLPLDTTSKVWPVDSKFPISSKFNAIHEGIDINCPKGTQVKAFRGGKVQNISKGTLAYGNVVYIKHGDNLISIYGCLQNISVKRGDTISAGDVIGTSGSTGISITPHLHFGIKKNGRAADPLEYVSLGDNEVAEDEYSINEEFTGDGGTQFATIDPNDIINVSKIKYNVYIIDPSTSYVNFNKLLSLQGSGVMLEAGYYYGIFHQKHESFVNSHLNSLVESARRAGCRWGLYMEARARNVSEAKNECKKLFYVISAYPPALGLWFKLDSNISKSVLEYYYEKCKSWGLMHGCGIYCNKNILNKLNWEELSEKFFLLYINNFKSNDEFEKLDTVLSPGFFTLDGTEDTVNYGTSSTISEALEEEDAIESKKTSFSNLKLNSSASSSRTKVYSGVSVTPIAT